MTDVDRAREYFRLVSEVGHEGFLARIAIAELAPLRVALERVGALLDEAVLIDLDSRDAAGRATRQYLEVEEAALERLDRELFEALHRLGPALDIRAA